MRKTIKNQYFMKDKKVKLVTKTTEKNDYGVDMPIYRYITDNEIWAYAKQLSQSQEFEAAMHGHEEIRLFVLNYREDLKLYDFIEYRGEYFVITRLDTTDDYKGELFVYVKDADKGDTPTDIFPAIISA